MEVALVTEMLDPLDGRLYVAAAARDRQVLGARANGHGPARHTGKESRRQQVDRRLAKPRGDMSIDRVLVDLARRTYLQQPPALNDTDALSHGHRFSLIMGDIDYGRAKIGLDTLQFKPHFTAQLGIQR